MRLVSDFSAVAYRSWTGPTVPDATWRPYVISEPVAQNWRWKLLAASLYSSFPSNEGVFLFAIPPALVGKIQNNSVFGNDLSFFTKAGASNNEPPLKGAVLLSEGMGANSAIPPEINSGNGGNSKFSSVNVLRRRSRAVLDFDVPAGWALFGYQSPDGGGAGSVNALVLSAMILPEDLCGCGGEPYKFQDQFEQRPQGQIQR